MEDNILGRDAVRQRPINLNAHVEGARLEDRLGREDVLDLGRSDSKGEGSESSVGRGVRVSADDRGAGEGEALFGADDLEKASAWAEEGTGRDDGRGRFPGACQSFQSS